MAATVNISIPVEKNVIHKQFFARGASETPCMER